MWLRLSLSLVMLLIAHVCFSLVSAAEMRQLSLGDEVPSWIDQSPSVVVDQPNWFSCKHQDGMWQPRKEQHQVLQLELSNSALECN